MDGRHMSQEYLRQFPVSVAVDVPKNHLAFSAVGLDDLQSDDEKVERFAHCLAQAISRVMCA